MPQNPGLTFLGFQKVNPLSNPKGVHFGTPAWAKKMPKTMVLSILVHFGTLVMRRERDFIRFAQKIPGGEPSQKHLKTSPPSAFCIFYAQTLN